MRNPLVSVIMSNYNTPEEYLYSSIESILNQTYQNFEIIIIDDASELPLTETLKKYNDQRIHIFENSENKGLAANLNTAIKCANGEYIARMDTDDISLPNRLQKQVDYLEDHPEVGVLGTSAIFFGQRKRIKKVINSHEKIKTSLLFQNQMLHPSVMMRKNLFNNSEAYDISFTTSQDYELWSRLIWETKFHNLPDILLKYRTHGGQLTAAKAKSQYEMSNLVRNRMLYLGKIILEDTEIELINKSASVKALDLAELHQLKELSDKIIVLNLENNFFNNEALMYSLSTNLDRSNYIYARENKVFPVANIKLEEKYYYNTYSLQKYFGKFYGIFTKFLGKQ
ncbi:glycosyltransferase [Aerococcus urinaeequi]